MKTLILTTNLVLLLVFAGLAQSVTNPASDNDIRYTNESFTVSWGHEAGSTSSCLDCNCNGVCDRAEGFSAADCASYDVVPNNCTINTGGTNDNNWSISTKNNSTNAYVSHGTISCSSGTCSKTITITAEGSYEIRVTGNGKNYYRDVTVYTRPSNPSTPTEASSSTCYNRILQRSSPPSNVTYYWQNAVNGTATNLGSGSTKSVNSGTWYLRARRTISSGVYVWSSGTTSGISVTEYASPTSYTISAGDNTVCSGVKTSIRLSDSQSNYTYRLLKNGSVHGSTIGGSGSAISWSNQDLGTYQIQAKRNGSCPWVTVSGTTTVSRQNAGSLSINTTGQLRGCPGQNITLSASGGSNLKWSYEDVTNASNPLTVDIYEGGDITYTVTGNESACGTSKSKSVVVGGYSPVKAVTISGITSKCKGGGTTTFTRNNAQNATSYTWSISPSSAGSINQSGVVTWQSGFSGDATVKVIAYGECSTSRQDTHVVNVIPPANTYSHSISAGSYNICVGTKTSITLGGARSGYKYRLLKNTSTDLGTKTSGYTWTNLDVGSYKIQGRPTGNQCSWVDVASTTINRKNPGTLTINTTGNLRGCPGQTITLSGSGGSNLSWSFEDTNDVPNPLSVDIYEGGDITYTVTGNESQCGTVVSKSEVVGGYLPVKAVTISGITSRCKGGGTTDFTRNNALNATSYTWSISPSSAGSINQSGRVTWQSGFSGNATVKVIAYGECSTSREDTHVVNVLAPATVYSVSASSYNLCSGDKATITLSDTQSAYKYRLLRDGSPVSTKNGTGGAINWTNQDVGLYKIQGRPQGNECSWRDMSGTADVKRLNPGSISMAQTGPLTGCDGDWVTITPTGGSNYELKEVGDDYSIPAEQDGTFRVQVRSGVAVNYNLTGIEDICSASDTQRVVVVSDEPYGNVVFDSGDNSVCQGDQDVAYTIEDIPRATISWSLEPSGAGSIVDGVVDWASGWHGTANVRARATGPCSFNKSQTFEVTVTPKVTVPVFVNPLAERNLGSGSTDYNVSSLGTTGYVWTLDPSGAGSINSTGVVTWNPSYYGPSTITVTASGTCGPSRTASTETMVKNPQILTLISPQANDIFIAGETMRIEWPEVTPGWEYNLSYRTSNGTKVTFATAITGQKEGANLVYNWVNVPSRGFVDILVEETRDIINFRASDVELIDVLDVTTPLAQSYGKGSETDIHWTGGSAQSGFLIELYENGSYANDIGVGAGGTYSWIIPNDLSNTYEYQIRVSQGEQEAFSETFTVIGCVQLVTPSADKNYIRTMVPRVPISECLDGRSKEEVIQSIAYVDGLGRPIQQIAIAASPGGADWVTGSEFDDYGRTLKQYLPYASDFQETTSGSFRGDWKNKQIDYLDERFNGSIDKNYGFSEQIVEVSPLNRSLKAAAPGQVWSVDNGAHLVENSYFMNGVSDEIPDVHVNDIGEIVFASGTYYGAGELTGIKVTDENNGDQEGETITWTNKAGQTVLKAVKIIDNNAVNYMKTLYGYDEFGNLRFVVQPQGIKLIEEGTYAWSDLGSPGFREKWMFTYEYDHRHRIIAKSIPGAEPVRMIYDVRDRLVMTQDGNQNLEEFTTTDVILDGSTSPIEPTYEVFGAKIKLQEGFHISSATGGTFHAKANPAIENGGWTFTKYDELNRPVMTGQIDRLDNYTTLVNDVQTFHEAGGAFGESFTGSGPLFGYTNNAYPFESNEGQNITTDNLLTVTFYDDYAFTNEPLPGRAIPNVIGQATGSKTRVLGTDTWLTTITFYDERYRIIKTISENYLGGKDIVDIEYLNSISELVIKTTTTHTGGEAVTIVEEHTYDHMDRLLTTTHSVNGSLPELIVSNTYNKIGELIEKNLGGSTEDNSPVQSVDFNYNIRGWLTTINNGSALDAAENDQFGMQLRYSDAEVGFQQFNGNIGQIQWKSLGGDGLQTTASQQFNYTYDAASRILSADYVGGDHDLSSIGYDFNGNIQNLSRNSEDVLTYAYGAGLEMSNQLLSVTDAGETDLFHDLNTTGNDYAYDDNGNMTKDLNKEISSITYNHLNLPELVSLGDGRKVEYTYDASGIKLLKRVIEGTVIDSTAYIGGIHYNMQDDGSGAKQLSLAFIQHASGRAEQNGSAFEYDYNLTDHLGNVRVTINESGSVVQRDDYYPFGLTFNHWNQSTQGGGENLYKYTGKEDQPETGWIDFGARMYQAELGRWFAVDMLADRAPQLTPYRYGFNNPIRYLDPDGLYETDGHYWTVYLAGTLLGLKDARRIAYFTELPDNEMTENGDAIVETATWARLRWQRYVHALTGGDATYERFRSTTHALRARNTRILGFALHRLGDSYAHTQPGTNKMFPQGIGHGNYHDGEKRNPYFPDKIKNRPDLYLEYVQNVIDVLSLKHGVNGDIDLFAFEYVAETGLDTEANSAILETEISLQNGVSNFSVVGDQTGVISDFISARDKKNGTKTNFETFTKEEEAQKYNVLTGMTSKKTQTRTYVRIQ